MDESEVKRVVSAAIAAQQTPTGDATPSRQARRRAEVVHRKRFMDGRMTPEEAHMKYGIPRDAKCACGARPLITCRIFMPLDEVVKRDGDNFAKMLLSKEGLDHLNKVLIQTKFGVYARVSTAYACKQHEKDLDLVAAKAPSWCIVEFNRGPGAERVVVGGPLDIEP